MFYKLAFKNVKKSLSDYVIYFLTLSFGVCLFYVFNAVEAQQTMLLRIHLLRAGGPYSLCQ